MKTGAKARKYGNLINCLIFNTKVQKSEEKKSTNSRCSFLFMQFLIFNFIFNFLQNQTNCLTIFNKSLVNYAQSHSDECKFWSTQSRKHTATDSGRDSKLHEAFCQQFKSRRLIIRENKRDAHLSQLTHNRQVTLILTPKIVNFSFHCLKDIATKDTQQSNPKFIIQSKFNIIS